VYKKMARTRRTEAQLENSFWYAVSGRWQTLHEVSKKVRMDIRTAQRLVSAYKENFEKCLLCGQIYQPHKRSQLIGERCFMIETAEENGRIICLRLIACNQKELKVEISDLL
jgi:hypothetical protein